MERLLFRVAKKWVAGYSASEAVSAALDANRRGMSAIVNFLGEDTVDAGQVSAAVGEYLALMDLLHKNKVTGCISVKPTQLGLAIDYDMCLRNFRALAAKAKELGQFMWVDMESIKFTEDTISIYLQLLRDYSEVGVAIQAYLRRSGADLLHILESGGNVRLVKGAYHEPEEHAFASKEEVDRNYSHLLKMLAENSSKSDNFVAVATHDSKLVDEAISLFFKDSKKKRFEFQLLMGIRDELKAELVARGMAVSEYIPYGSQWLPYSARRIRERKRNILLLARSLIQS
jgi:proline dehydrogenase